jgi:hypothetical protein
VQVDARSEIVAELVDVLRRGFSQAVEALGQNRRRCALQYNRRFACRTSGAREAGGSATGRWWKCVAVLERQQALASQLRRAVCRLNVLGIVDSAALGTFASGGRGAGCIRGKGHGALPLEFVRVRHNHVFWRRSQRATSIARGFEPGFHNLGAQHVGSVKT